MRLKFLLPILAAGFAALAAPPAVAQGTGPFSPVIKVNDSVVTGYEMDQRIKFLTLLGFPGDKAAEAERGLIEDRLRGLKLRVPVEGLRIKLVPDEAELAQCCTLGESLARHLTGQLEHRELDMASLA